MTLDELTLTTAINEAGQFKDVRISKEFAERLLELLKEQKPVNVIIHDEDEWYGFYAQCPECACEWMMDHEKLKYCPHCGKAVKWE